MSIYVEGDVIDVVNEGVAEGDGVEVGEGSKGAAGGEGVEVGEGSEGAVEGEGFEGAEVGEGERDELIDSDFDTNGEDYTKGRDNDVIRLEDQVVRYYSESGESSEDEEEDVVNNDEPLNEHSNKSEFKKALQSHAIKTKRTLKFIKNDKIFDVKNVKTKWIKDKYLHKFKSDPKKCVKGFRVDIINELRVNVSKQQAYRAKKAALKEIEGNPDWQYSRLWDCSDEIRSNPNSTVIVGTEQMAGEERFSRFYVCFRALKAGFSAGCRPIIGVDGCHLKGPHGGILLTAIGVDPNNNLFPIAYAIISSKRRTLEPTVHGQEGSSSIVMLPPLPPQDEPTLESCITQQVQSQAAEGPVYRPGPSMYQQLQQSNPQLHPRVQIRAPPPMIGVHGLPVFSTASRTQSGTNHNPIITEGGQKYLDLSQISSTDV
ncbi:UNVERIFIED_CONTAM: hypothetical protein Sradi_3228100 [Sesamum radiatum]|uniref:Transposase n=1 Tax=Sesamum radiatum TaxID=300843 RepID=A0AAW2RID3_SESRA